MTNNDELALKSRETFEHWWQVYYHNGKPPRLGWQAWREGDGYKTDEDDSELNDLWNSWQAAQSSLLAERDADKKRIADMQQQLARYSMSPGEADQRRCESRAVRDALGFGKDADNVAPVDLLEQISALRLRIADMQVIVNAAEKLVRCKGRYHSEQNYRALAALFGVTTPDLPPIETEARTVSVKLPVVPSQYETLKLCLEPSDGYGMQKGAEYMRDEFIKALAAAGIKMEVGE